MMDDNTSLSRDLEWWDCSAIIVGIMIGTGIFSVFPTLIAQHNISTPLILLSWIAGGIFAWFGAMCYAELTSILPCAGGDYTFLHKAYSHKGENLISFLFAWSQVFVIRPSSIVVLALIFGNELNKILSNLNASFDGATFITAFGVIALFTVINILGLKLGKRFQNIMSAMKAAILLVIVVYGFYKFRAMMPIQEGTILPKVKNLWGITWGFWSALVLTMWVYGGWNEAVYVSEETKNPSRDIPKALTAGLFAVILLYVGVNYIYIINLTTEGLAKTFNPASDLMKMWFGIKGSIIMSSIIVISAAGAINALIMTGGRMSYAIAKDLPALKKFASLHSRLHTPIMALLANLVITLILLLLSRGNISFVENLTFYTSGVFWYFFGLVVISLIILRRHIAVSKIPFRVPLYPYSPILFLLITLCLIWGAVNFKPFETLAGICILNIGIPLYYFFNMNKNVKINLG